MPETTQLREKLVILIDRYQKNKKQVPKKDLRGKYKKAFDSLKQEIKENAEEYLTGILVEGVYIQDDDEGWQVVDDINALLDSTSYGLYIGNAIFKHFSLEEAEEITKKYRERIYENILSPYYKKIHLKEEVS